MRVEVDDDGKLTEFPLPVASIATCWDNKRRQVVTVEFLATLRTKPMSDSA